MNTADGVVFARGAAKIINKQIIKANNQHSFLSLAYQ
jgi:hypothetical protein